MSDYTPERWAEIKALHIGPRYTPYWKIPKVNQGEGRNGRKAYARVGLSRKHWPKVA